MTRYPTYYPIEFDYVQELPEDWQLLPNIAIFNERIARGFSHEELLAVTIRKGIIKQTELENKKDISNEDKSHYKLVKSGDIAYNKMRMWQGSVGYSQYRGIVSPAYVVLNPKVPINPKYFHYLFRTDFYVNYSKRLSYGICDDQIFVGVPQILEQQQIVLFIENEVVRIEEAITKAKKQITLANDYLHSLIFHTVTGQRAVPF